MSFCGCCGERGVARERACARDKDERARSRKRCRRPPGPRGRAGGGATTHIACSRLAGAAAVGARGRGKAARGCSRQGAPTPAFRAPGVPGRARVSGAGVKSCCAYWLRSRAMSGRWRTWWRSRVKRRRQQRVCAPERSSEQARCWGVRSGQTRRNDVAWSACVSRASGRERVGARSVARPRFHRAKTHTHPSGSSRLLSRPRACSIACAIELFEMALCVATLRVGWGGARRGRLRACVGVEAAERWLLSTRRKAAVVHQNCSVSVEVQHVFINWWFRSCKVDARGGYWRLLLRWRC